MQWRSIARLLDSWLKKTIKALTREDLSAGLIGDQAGLVKILKFSTIILSREQILLRGCAGWFAPLLFASNKVRVSCNNLVSTESKIHTAPNDRFCTIATHIGMVID